MSYDIAVWVGDLPASDAAAAIEFAGRMEAPSSSADVSGAIEELVAMLLARWPDDADSSPWSMTPLIGAAQGDFIYITMTYSGAGDGVLAIANEAARLGLVCFDPQDEMMLN